MYDDVISAAPETTAGISLMLVILENIYVTPSTPENVAIFEEIAVEYRASHMIEEVKRHPIVRAYRDFYWRVLKIDPTKTRPSSEALVRRILAGNPLPKISNIDDAYNAASLATYVSIGAYDLDKISFPLVLRLVEAGEEFNVIGTTVPINFEGNELILCSADGAILNQYPYRDAQFSRVTPSVTKNAVIACGVPGIGVQDLISTIDIAVEYVNRVQWEPCKPVLECVIGF